MPSDQHVNPAEEPSSTPSPGRPADPAADGTTFLPGVLRDHPELRDVSRLTLFESFSCVRLVLWDESLQRLVSFREIGRGHAVSAAPARA